MQKSALTARITRWIGYGMCFFVALSAHSADMPNSLRNAIAHAVDTVKPALVRIHVVETYYSEGREMKFEASGSGVVITAEGHVITNHHVAGHAKQLKCTFANKEEVEAELVGTDPLTDIAVIKLCPETPRTFPVVAFSDSAQVKVGDHVLAMGSPLALSQSVTLGIVSNTEMIMPDWISRYGGLEQDGEDVGALVRWLGHDAEIFGGNSGGPLVNLQGDIIGINEIKMGLSGAIPGNLAKSVAHQLMTEGKVRRAWLGMEVQPRLKHADDIQGILVSGVLAGGPAALAGVESGDILLSINDQAVDVQFAEQLPDFNLLVSQLPIGKQVNLKLMRAGQEQNLQATVQEREPYQAKQYALKQWGLTVRDISYLMAKEMKRPNTEGVLVTSVRPGGPAGDAKPLIMEKDVIVEVGGKAVKSVSDLQSLTADLTQDATEPVPLLTSFERKTGAYVTVVKVGVKEQEDPGLEVKKAWLPVDTQVITRDIADLLGDKKLTGFRITQVYKGSTAEQAGLQVGDLILAVDGEKMTASAPEHYEELSAWIRQYRIGATAELTIQRAGAQKTVSVELVRAPKLAREMKKYRDTDFEFTVRNVTFFDRETEQWKKEQHGVLVEQVKPGGWAALGQLAISDLILAVDDAEVPDVTVMKTVMQGIAQNKPKAVTFKVLRGIHTFYVELEPKWNGK